MAKTLEMNFNTVNGKVAKVSIENPIEPIDPAKVAAAVDTIIAANIFISAGGDLVAKRGARVVERNVEDVTIA